MMGIFRKGIEEMVFNMKAGNTLNWLDQGPAILLKQCEIPSPCNEESLEEMLGDVRNWPASTGWTVLLVSTGEILDVHEETLDTNFFGES